MASYWVFLLNNTNIHFLKSVSNAAQLKLLENQTRHNAVGNTKADGSHRRTTRLLPLPSVISKDSRKRSSSLISASASYKTKVGTIKAFSFLQRKSRHHNDKTQSFGKWSIHWNVHTVHFQVSRDHSPPPEIREQRPSQSRPLWSGHWHPWCLYKSEKEVHIWRGWERKHF